MALDFFNALDDAASLYILGDLFEYWIGDDAGLPIYQDAIAALASLSAAGCTVTVMLGNRDFLLGDAFAAATGARLICDDELLIDVHGKPVLLLHGDTLCIDDTAYQKFRMQVRKHEWQAQFLAKSIDERIAIAAQLREQSRNSSAGKTSELMDVNLAEVQSRLGVHHCQTLIHGHTHRPADHIDLSSGTRRLVVGDWQPTQAQYVLSNDKDLSLETWTG